MTAQLQIAVGGPVDTGAPFLDVDSASVAQYASGVGELIVVNPTWGIHDQHLRKGDLVTATVVGHGGGRYLIDTYRILSTSGERTEAGTQLRTARGMPETAYQLLSALVGHEFAAPGGHAVTLVGTPGRLVLDVTDAAQARGWFPGFVKKGTRSNDADQLPWQSDTVTGAWSALDTALRVLNDLSGKGELEWKVSRSVLRLYAPGNLGVDRTASTSSRATKIDIGQHADSAPVSSTWEPASAALVCGADGLFEWVVDSSKLAKHGRLEIGVDARDIRLTARLNRAGNLALAAQNARSSDHTVALSLIDGPVPGDDVDVGDWVPVLDNEGDSTRLRISGWSLDLANGETTGTLSLGTRIEAMQERLLSALEALVARHNWIAGQPPPPETTP